MRKAKSTARGAQQDQLMPPLQSSSPSSAVLVATALLLGCAGSALPGAAAAAASVTPAASSGAPLRRSGPHSREEREPLLPPLAPLAPRGGVGAGRTARPSWFVARTTRGGGLFRRRRNGGGSDGGGGGDSIPADVAAEEQKGEEGEEEEEEATGGDKEEPQESSSEGFTVAAGTTGGSGRGGSLVEGGGTQDGVDGGGSQSDEQPVPHVPPIPSAGGIRGAQASDSDDDEDGGSSSSSSSSSSGSSSSSSEEEMVDVAGGSREEGEDEEEGRGSVEGAVGDEQQQDEEGGESGEGEGRGAGTKPAAAEGERHRPTAPLFSFPPGPRVRRTDAEESLQEVLPMQQRLVKYLTEDRVFGAQILLSAYFFISAVAYSIDSVQYAACFKSALGALTLKHWGTVVGRVRRVLVPHLLYEPQSRYVKYRARVSALALDPAVQGIVYCAVFMLMPLGHALLPLLVKEAVYLLWVVKEVLQIVAPALVETLITLMEPVMSVFMTAGDVEKWKDTPSGEKRLLLGRRLAQVCFKLEMAMPFSVALRVLPGTIQATLGAGAGVAEAGTGGGGGRGGGVGVGGQIARALPLMKVGALMMTYVKLLTVKNAQLEDDVRILRGLKIRGYNCEWVEQAADSVVFGKMVGCPWWVGLLASGFALLPNHEATKTVMASDDKLKTLGMTLLNLAIGRTPGAEDDDEDEDSDDDTDNKENKNATGETPPASKIAKMAKVAAVATGVSDF